MKLPPEERVRTWFIDIDKGTSATALSAKDDESVLISLGLDTVPALAKIVRTGGLNQQLDAVSLLCDMDRFVPLAELPAPEPFGHVGPYLGYGFKGAVLGHSYDRYTGEFNPYMMVDGRRIGPQGQEAVQWAATQTTNKSLRTFARNCSGLTSEDLRQLNTIDLLAQWRKGLVGGVHRHSYWVNLDSAFIPVADDILIQRADQSIPLLAKIAVDDKEQEVRLHAREVLLRIDVEKVRLRGSEAGRTAIAALTKSARIHPLPEWRILARTSVPMAEKAHREFIQAIDDQTMDDKALRGDPPFGWLARAFAALYGDDTTVRKSTAMETVTVVRPEFRQFTGYMTRIDPAFPGWECSNSTVTAPYIVSSEIIRPCFKARVERLHKYWLQYQSEIKAPSNSGG